MIARTHHLPTHTPFFRLIMHKNALNTFYFELLFFPLYSFSLPPKHLIIIFSGKLTTKNDQKTSRKEKKNFFLFLFIIYSTFSLSPYGNKQKHLLFPPFLSSEIEKPQGKTSHKNFNYLFILFFFFYILPLFVIGKITIYLFFRNSDLKCPKMPISALKFHFLQITFLFCRDYANTSPTHTHSVFPTHNV